VNDAKLAAQLVREAGQLAASMLADGVQVDRKSSVSDIVTAADHAAEEHVVARLRVERPDDGLIGEEGTNLPGARTWFIDPVDGTYNFASGLPTWCSAIALVDADGAVVSAIYQPSTDELWVGGRARPTTLNGMPVERLADRRLADVSVSSYLHPTTLPDEDVRLPLLNAIAGAATVRMLGSGSVELAAVAGGRLGAYVQYDSHPWDWHPGSTLVTAAGGVSSVVRHRGHSWHIAGAASLVAEITDRLTSV
jgi:myo-inositol-1(or 4)-monophosphatase